jgi:hypothetical protein
VTRAAGVNGTVTTVFPPAVTSNSSTAAGTTGSFGLCQIPSPYRPGRTFAMMNSRLPFSWTAPLYQMAPS